MNFSLALVLLIAIAGLAECKPQGDLKARMLAKAAKRAEGDQEWPFAWFEYASLVGKCQAAINWLEYLKMDVPQDGGVLSEACPHALTFGEELADADEEESKKAGEFLKEIFGLLQCVNLQAEREELAIVLGLNNKDVSKDVFMTQSGELTKGCEAAFENAEKEAEKFEQELKKYEDSKAKKRGASIQALLRQLLNTRRKR